MQQHIRILQFLQCGLEGVHQLMGQLADKADGIGDHHVHGVADRQQTAGGVQRIKQAVIGGDPGIRQGIKQGALTCVGIAHDGNHGDLVFHAALALGTPDAAHFLQLLFQLVDLPVDVAAVGLQLSLAGALGANGTLAAGTGLTLQMGPHTGQAGQQILILRQLHLQAALSGSGSLGEDIKDQSAAIQHLHPQILRQCAHLRGAEVVIENDHGGALAVHQFLDLCHFALADEGAGLRHGAVLQHRGCHLTAGGFHQRGQVLQRCLIRIVPSIQPGAVQTR